MYEGIPYVIEHASCHDVPVPMDPSPELLAVARCRLDTVDVPRVSVHQDFVLCEVAMDSYTWRLNVTISIAGVTNNWAYDLTHSNGKPPASLDPVVPHTRRVSGTAYLDGDASGCGTSTGKHRSVALRRWPRCQLLPSLPRIAMAVIAVVVLLGGEMAEEQSLPFRPLPIVL
jgi:hypothetical protein